MIERTQAVIEGLPLSDNQRLNLEQNMTEDLRLLKKLQNKQNYAKKKID